MISVSVKVFNSLHYEAGFYVGCLNLFYKIKQLNSFISFPVPVEIHRKDLIFEELFDLSLLIKENTNPVSNNLNAVDKSLFIITGANQGGKSTFLRSIDRNLFILYWEFLSVFIYGQEVVKKDKLGILDHIIELLLLDLKENIISQRI